MKKKHKNIPGKIDTHVILPCDLHKKLTKLAIKEQRSLNKQIVYILQIGLKEEV